jgi:hypothetical protein
MDSATVNPVGTTIDVGQISTSRVVESGECRFRLIEIARLTGEKIYSSLEGAAKPGDRAPAAWSLRPATRTEVALIRT